MILAHKIQLKVTNKQANHLQQACGVARHAYNWGLDRWGIYRKCDLTCDIMQINRDYNKCKKALFPWTYNVTKCAGQGAIFKDLKHAFKEFFARRSKYPKFKKKGVHDSFYISNDRFAVFEKVVKLPIIGKVRMTERLRFKGKIMNAVISRKADKWYIAITVDLGDGYQLPTAKGSVGIDLGIKTAIVTSDGDFMGSPKPLKKHLKQLQRSQRQFSKKKKGSKNREKAKIKVARLYMKIANIRKDWIHKITTKLANENQVVCMEDLAVSNLLKNHRLAQSISDMGWYEIYRQLIYKTQMRSGTVVKIDRFFPSSKTCNSCGLIKEKLSLSKRTFSCECGHTMDRDLNAAKNIHTRGLRGFQACGDRSSGLSRSEKSETTVSEAGTDHSNVTIWNKNQKGVFVKSAPFEQSLR